MREIVTHRLSGHRDAVRYIRDTVPEAVRLVRQAKSGPMPRTRWVLTTLDGLHEVGAESIGRAVGVPRSVWENDTLHGEHGPSDRPYAYTVIAPHGVDILIAVREALDVLDGVLVHEPVHALQIGRARRDETAFMLHEYGVHPLSAWQLRRAHQRRRHDEAEAQRIEHRLLARL
ncbi:hypothetical protein [Streptomyces sp. BPTC-684]|uniref:hypothetical protein n=1 Tax=Streptomyces sp. BPTC-684 TaxID=3043734 RepID=UPI0024B1C7D4|nr:hypothetical protein [Streptomyces sp. BPTC-684]WHM41139.1 hypothetical protein QIY60_32630 [Streptomyces sp. BPTC-684]